MNYSVDIDPASAYEHLSSLIKLLNESLVDAEVNNASISCFTSDQIYSTADMKISYTVDAETIIETIGSVLKLQDSSGGGLKDKEKLNFLNHLQDIHIEYSGGEQIMNRALAEQYMKESKDQQEAKLHLDHMYKKYGESNFKNKVLGDIFDSCSNKPCKIVISSINKFGEIILSINILEYRHFTVSGEFEAMEIIHNLWEREQYSINYDAFSDNIKPSLIIRMNWFDRLLTAKYSPFKHFWEPFAKQKLKSKRHNCYKKSLVSPEYKGPRCPRCGSDDVYTQNVIPYGSHIVCNHCEYSSG